MSSHTHHNRLSLQRETTAYKLEFLAMYWAITKKFSHYLLGRKFLVTTDHNPLTYILTSAKLDAAGHRWIAELGNYNFSIAYKPGKANIDADRLSRLVNREISEESIAATVQGYADEEWHGLVQSLSVDVQSTAHCHLLSTQEEKESLIDWAVEQDKDSVLLQVKQAIQEDRKVQKYSKEV